MNSRNFRFPPVLADQLRIAFRHIRSIDEQHGEGSALDFLERHRRNKGRMLTSALARRGLSPVEIEPIPWELKTSGMLDEIDHAFKAMHRYREGGAGDYIAKDVVSEVNRAAGRKRSNSTKEPHENIRLRAKNLGYHESDNKKAIVMQICSEMDISESTFYRALR